MATIGSLDIQVRCLAAAEAKIPGPIVSYRQGIHIRSAKVVGAVAEPGQGTPIAVAERRRGTPTVVAELGRGTPTVVAELGRGTPPRKDATDAEAGVWGTPAPE
jgi:hypothetical protein